MPIETRPAFLDDPYLTACECKVMDIVENGGIVLDQTNFYAASGGQPGDNGMLERSDGSFIKIATTKNGNTKQEIILIPEEGEKLPEIGETLVGHINWNRRYKLMQMHTACHLLSVVCPYPVTGAAVNENDSRIDFDMSQSTLNRDDVTRRLIELVNENHPVSTQWITEDELEANPSIVRSKNVRPPRGLGKIRLVCIGQNGSIDSQPCGGTHVTETAEIGDIHISKIEKKGKQNRRFRIRFGKDFT